VKKRYLLLPCLLIVSALALAACGSSGSSDEGQIEEAIETAATGSEASKCTEVETQEFVEQSTQESGSAAVKQCEKEAEEEKGTAESVEVTNVEVEGEEASADAALTGGSLNGQTVEIALVEEGGNWKLNEITGFAKFDQAKLAEALEEQLSESGEVSEELATCVVEGVEEASPAEAEELLLSGSPEGFEELAKECS
jgi:ABC-type glycerol-3-phosphate transport system substrate-binding protein